MIYTTNKRAGPYADLVGPFMLEQGIRPKLPLDVRMVVRVLCVVVQQIVQIAMACKFNASLMRILAHAEKLLHHY